MFWRWGIFKSFLLFRAPLIKIPYVRARIPSTNVVSLFPSFGLQLHELIDFKSHQVGWRYKESMEQLSCLHFSAQQRQGGEASLLFPGELSAPTTTTTLWLRGSMATAHTHTAWGFQQGHVLLWEIVWNSISKLHIFYFCIVLDNVRTKLCL